MSLPDRRLVSDWLTSYMEFTAEQESAEQLHRWTGLAVLAAALRRKVYIELLLGDVKRVFSNIYVIIVAMSAKARKSAAMDIGRDLLIDAISDVKIMRDSMTSQGLIKALNHEISIIKNDQIIKEMRSDVAIFADEVANLFSYDKTRSAQMVIFLTRTYECPALYDHTTARDNTVRLHNLYPVLLAGTDPNNLKVLPEEAVGGLTGRLIWVIESTRRKNITGWKRDERKLLRQRLLREYLIHDLQRIARMQGEIQVKPEAMNMYDGWYEALSKRDANDPETDAFYQRCHTTALRLAILLSCSANDTLMITEKQMNQAIQLIEGQLPELKRVTMWSGASVYSQARAKALSYLQRTGGNGLRRLLLKHMGMPLDEFDKLIATLVTEGSIEPPKVIGNEVLIKLTKQGWGRDQGQTGKVTPAQ